MSLCLVEFKLGLASVHSMGQWIVWTTYTRIIEIFKKAYIYLTYYTKILNIYHLSWINAIKMYRYHTESVSYYLYTKMLFYLLIFTGKLPKNCSKNLKSDVSERERAHELSFACKRLFRNIFDSWKFFSHNFGQNWPSL